MDHKIDVYDNFASQYSDMIGGWEEGEVERYQSPLLPTHITRIHGCLPGGGFSVAAPGGSAHP